MPSSSANPLNTSSPSKRDAAAQQQAAMSSGTASGTAALSSSSSSSSSHALLQSALSSSSSSSGRDTSAPEPPPAMSAFGGGMSSSRGLPSLQSTSQMFNFDATHDVGGSSTFSNVSLGTFMRSFSSKDLPSGDHSLDSPFAGGPSMMLSSPSSSALVPADHAPPQPRSSAQPFHDAGSNLMLGSLSANPGDQQYVDITEYLNMPQYTAAKKLGLPASTLSKRWKEAVRTRKWPYRTVQKLDKEITTLLHNVPQGPDAPPLPKEIENTLGQLLRKRQEELSPVIIRL